MKVLIWFLCIFANALITVLLKYAGITLGGIPTALLLGVMIWLARTLCKKWDEHKASKTPIQPPEINVKSVEKELPTEKKILFCRKCGERLIDNSQFCRKCGTEVIKE